MNTNNENKFYMPAEWHLHESCWMQWPHENPNNDSYGKVPNWSNFDIKKAYITWSNIAKSIAHQQVLGDNSLTARAGFKK